MAVPDAGRVFTLGGLGPRARGVCPRSTFYATALCEEHAENGHGTAPAGAVGRGTPPGGSGGSR